MGASPNSLDLGAGLFVLLRGVLGVTFIWAGLGKIRRPDTAARLVLSVGGAREVRKPSVGLLTAVILLGLVETVLGAAVGLNLHVRIASIAMVAVLVVVTMFVILALARGVKAPCGCFGSRDERPLSITTLWRNVAMLLLATVILLAGSNRPVQFSTAVTAILEVGVLVVAALLIEWRRLKQRSLPMASTDQSRVGPVWLGLVGKHAHEWSES
jgi:uncharacterized membrane protein YphA (DoxX/SURF4 family)